MTSYCLYAFWLSDWRGGLHCYLTDCPKMWTSIVMTNTSIDNWSLQRNKFTILYCFSSNGLNWSTDSWLGIWLISGSCSAFVDSLESVSGKKRHWWSLFLLTVMTYVTIISITYSSPILNPTLGAEALHFTRASYVSWNGRNQPKMYLWQFRLMSVVLNTHSSSFNSAV